MSDEIVTVQEFARRYSVGIQTVRSWVKKKQIPYEFLGNMRLRRIAESKKLVTTPIAPDDEDPVV